MAAHDESATFDQLDRWIAEVGEDYIARLVEETSRGVTEGTIPAFTDKDAFLEHLRTTIAHKPA
ncbi:MAG: hypothetical protein ACRDZ8_15725 [Acidimicrobiales bacterium]